MFFVRRSLIAALVLALVLVSAFASCTSKTPDVIASEAAAELTLETLNWTIEVEGADVTSYSRADADKHELSKMIVSMLRSCDGTLGVEALQNSFRVDGINLYEFLEDVGRPDATAVTYYGVDVFHKDTSFRIEGDLLKSDDVKIGWIMNIKNVLIDSESYVGVFGASSLKDFESCCWVTKIVIE